ncbi:hypothetical protein GF343_05920 [Candidatus Woesearchaeota archaeon]|nr:hypothetical protein [Candidatus Woesearchaeota archaeon]
MSKKSAVGVNTFVKILAVIIVLVVFILIIPSFRQVLEGAVQTGECQWDMLFSALMQAGSMGLGGSSEFKSCRARYVNITMEDLYEYQLEAAQRMQVYRKNPKLYDDIVAQGFGVSPEDDPSLYYDKQLEWAMNKIIADEMRTCWNKVWKGNLPIFDQWWNLVDFTFFGALDKGYSEEQLKNIDDWNAGILEVYGPPTFCIICARIKFGRDVRMKFKNKPIASLMAWMSDNPAPDSKQSYLKELLEGQTIPSKLFLHKYIYTVDEPHAIVYKRVNPHKVAAVARWFGSKVGLSEEAVTVNQIVIAPYDMIVKSSEEGGLGCYPPVVD